MNYLDIIILIPVIFLAFKGFKNGFIKELANIVALLAGLWVAMHFSSIIGEFLVNNTAINGDYVPLLAFALTFILVILVVHLLSGVLDKLVKAIALGWINSILGVVFGAAKALLILSVLVYVFDKILIERYALIGEDVFESSVIYPYLSECIETIFPLVKKLAPDEIANSFKGV